MRTFSTLSIALSVVLSTAAFVVGPAAAQEPAKADAALVDAYIKRTFSKASPEWQARIEPDGAQRACSGATASLSPDAERKLIEDAKAAVVYPADGNLIGDWKKGQQLAQRGTGGQFSDRPGGPIGGNCYACHQLSPAELSYGTLGPSLTGYGKSRRFKPEEARAAYAKIWNAQTVQPCSNMPRFGHNKFLSVEQIKDLTAYLFDPESPVNK
jgi:sulfur-oxidizing protein SoxX